MACPSLDVVAQAGLSHTKSYSGIAARKRRSYGKFCENADFMTPIRVRLRGVLREKPAEFRSELGDSSQLQHVPPQRLVAGQRRNACAVFDLGEDAQAT